jgi:hypothetical protein
LQEQLSRWRRNHDGYQYQRNFQPSTFKRLSQTRITLTLMSHQDRNRRLVEEVVGHAAKWLFAQAGVTIAAHDNEVSLSPLRFRDQRGGDVAVSALGAEQSLILGGSLVGGEDNRHLFSSVEERHSFSKRPYIESPNLHSPGYPSFAVDRLQAHEISNDATIGHDSRQFLELSQ